jgi:O-methyltransferase involved in polyketide biosynthesis
MTMVDGNAVAGVSTTTLGTLRSRATEAKRADSALDDPWAVKLFGFCRRVDDGYGMLSSW